MSMIRIPYLYLGGHSERNGCFDLPSNVVLSTAVRHWRVPSCHRLLRSYVALKCVAKCTIPSSERNRVLHSFFKAKQFQPFIIYRMINTKGLLKNSASCLMAKRGKFWTMNSQVGRQWLLTHSTQR